MNSGYVFGGIASALIALFVGFVARRVRTKPNPVRHSGRLRLPKVVLFVGVLLLAVGFLMILVAFMDPPEDDAVAMRIASIAIFIAGGLFVAGYFTYFMEIGSGRVVTRGFDGAVRIIPFERIVRYRLVKDSNGKDILKLESVDGTRININIEMFDAGPLLDYLAQREAQWASRLQQADQDPRVNGDPRINQLPRPIRNPQPYSRPGSPPFPHTHSPSDAPYGSSFATTSPPSAKSPSPESSSWQSGNSAWDSGGKNDTNEGPFHDK